MNKEQLKALRENLGLTQAKMAETLGTSRSTYIRYETGKTAIKKSVEKLAELESAGLMV